MTAKTTKTPAPLPALKNLPLNTIRLDGGTQPRVRIDPETVREYAERMKAGDRFPPVQVYFDGTDHWLSDGFHRVKAAGEAGIKSIQAEVWEGTRDDAFWMSLAANKDHGLRRTNEDKVRAVKAALATRPKFSDRSIAEHVGVSHEMVRKHRLSTVDSQTTGEIRQSAERTGRDGRTINTANIGKAAGAKAEAPAPPDPDDIPLDIPGTPQGTATASGGAPAAEVVTDQEGHVVEGKVADAFRRRHELQALVLAVMKVKSNVLKAVEAKDPLYTDILPSRFQADCGNVIRQLKAAMPHAACPYCRAAGCKACHGRGWVGELAWNAAPKELKR
ncbi:MAG: hypothetical protein FJ288_18025 [Planctomycetes bacterium]|nr:hypothetical protein [Planctomycetota bacterium]